MIYHVNRKDKKAGGTRVISENVKYKRKIVTSDKERLLIMINGIIHQEKVKILTVYETNKRASKYMK